jgi:hypothetical protein
MIDELWSFVQNTQRNSLITNPHNQPQIQNSKTLMIVTFTKLSTINLKVEKHLRIVEGFKEQPLIVVPPYWYGSNPYAFLMETLMMSMSTNATMSLQMPIWNMMTYPTMGDIDPLVPKIQIHVIVLVQINAHKSTMTQQILVRVVVGCNNGHNSPLVSPPLNVRGGVVPQEPPNGGWFIHTIY